MFFFSWCYHLSLPIFSYWSKFHVNIITNSGATTNWPEIWTSEIPPSEFSTISGDWCKLGILKKKKKKLYGPFLWIGFKCLKARATSRRQFTNDLGRMKGWVDLGAIDGFEHGTPGSGIQHLNHSFGTNISNEKYIYMYKIYM